MLPSETILGRGGPCVLLALGLLFAEPASASWQLDGPCQAVFHASVRPEVASFEGKTSEIAVVDDGRMLSFRVAMSSVHTGIGLRDRDMNDKYLQIATYPDIVLQISRTAISPPMGQGESLSGQADASFVVRGIAEPVVVSYVVTRSGEGWDVSASFDFDVSKHGVAGMNRLGIHVNPAMRADVTLHLLDR
jgi:hypothetical protein